MGESNELLCSVRSWSRGIIMKMSSRAISDGDVGNLKHLFYEHGINDWNSFDECSIDEQISLVKEGSADIVFLEDASILGVAFLIYGTSCPDKLKKYYALEKICFIKDVVVSSELHGQGFGTRLVEFCLTLAAKENYEKMFIERHEENIASKKMMEKSGFQVVDRFYDPDKRRVGTRKTVVSSKDLRMG